MIGRFISGIFLLAAASLFVKIPGFSGQARALLHDSLNFVQSFLHGVQTMLNRANV